MKLNNNHKVSIVIPTKNSSKFLEACLESIKKQTYENIEIIVVDNFSTDNTREISLKYTDKFFEKGPERSAQVNYGVEMSTGDFVYKIDSDFILEKEVVDQCVKKIEEGCDAVIVHNSPDISVSWIAKIRKFEVDMYKYGLTHSSARFVKKSVYKKIGGFNEKITAGEDYDFQNKLNLGNYKIGFVDDEAIHLGEPTKFWPHIYKYYQYGKDSINYKQAGSGNFKNQINNTFLLYLKNWKKFVFHPVLGTEFVLYNFFKFGAGGLGFLSTKINRKI